MANFPGVVLVVSLFGFGLMACSSNPPEDPRYDHFGTGLPEKHDESVSPPYPNKPFVPGHDSLSDQDKDGVIDHRDECEEHDQDTSINNQGCALQLSAIHTINLDIEFASGKSDIQQQYYPEIEKLAELLQKNAEFTLLIEGHTDNSGSRSSNMSLSRQRAEAVGSTLINEFKIPKEKILTAGFGPDRPIADNSSAEGRQKNRRMVAHAVTRDRLIARHYNVWSIELGTPPNTDIQHFQALN